MRDLPLYVRTGACSAGFDGDAGQVDSAGKHAMSNRGVNMA